MLACLYLQKNRQANRYRPRTPWPVLLSPRQVSRCQYTCPWDLGEQQPLSHSGKLVEYTDSILLQWSLAQDERAVGETYIP